MKKKEAKEIIAALKDYDLEFKGGGMCPEQYDVFLNGKQVAYVRLRWGYLSVDCPGSGDIDDSKEIYSYEFEDDMKGSFTTEERKKYFGIISQRIKLWIEEQE